ncbi:hypothetical protein BDZ45DRAFT_801277 [Acephala macrosclerotiorum]|nr:hypothetical protein BDZ45DRAFT_801277 [Acephala macrosclerotiorum]
MTMENNTIKPLTHIQHVSLDYSSSTRYGPVDSGEIVIRALRYPDRCIGVDSHGQDSKTWPKFQAYMCNTLFQDREFNKCHVGYDGQQFAVLQLGQLEKNITVLGGFNEEVDNSKTTIMVACLIPKSIAPEELQGSRTQAACYRRVGLITIDESVNFFVERDKVEKEAVNESRE